MRGLSDALDGARNAAGISSERNDLERLAKRHQRANQLRRVPAHTGGRRAECVAVESDAERV